MTHEYRTYGVDPRKRVPLVEFMVRALHECGCRTLFVSPPDRAPFRITFETDDGERMGIVAYAFLANQRVTRNRPADEHRFQIKYGARDGKLHTIWQDPFGLYTTLFLGINPEAGFFVGADPVLHNPTKHFISLEFKDRDAQEVMRRGWHTWERDARRDEPIEVLVGGVASSFLRYIRFEREALGEDQGHRHLLAQRFASPASGSRPKSRSEPPPARQLHQLAQEFALTEQEVLDLIENTGRVKMNVRGRVAEEHLHRLLRTVEGVTECIRLGGDSEPDIGLRFDGRPVTVECKNVLRKTTAAGIPRVDFQRTRAAKADPCSRYYSASEFDVVAACLHSITEKWEFRFAPSVELEPHRRCAGKLNNTVKVDDRWLPDPRDVLGRVA